MFLSECECMTGFSCVPVLHSVCVRGPQGDQAWIEGACLCVCLGEERGSRAHRPTLAPSAQITNHNLIVFWASETVQSQSLYSPLVMEYVVSLHHSLPHLCLSCQKEGNPMTEAQKNNETIATPGVVKEM